MGVFRNRRGNSLACKRYRQVTQKLERGLDPATLHGGRARRRSLEGEPGEREAAAGFVLEFHPMRNQTSRGAGRPMGAAPGPDGESGKQGNGLKFRIWSVTWEKP